MVPNGRSGGFSITGDQLEALLRALPSDTFIAKTLDRSVTAGEVIDLLAEHGKNQVFVEVQDHAWYIVHLKTWITINASSGLYSSLRQYHAAWLKDIPRSASTGQGTRGSERTGDEDRPTMLFPELMRQSTFDFAVVVVSGMVGAVLLAAALRTVSGLPRIVIGVLGIVASLPWVVWVVYSVWQGIWNAVLRYRWSRQFPRRLSCKQLRAALAADPGRFVVHVRYFGGFDIMRLCPAAVLEDRTTGELAAVYPPDWQVTEMCEQFHVSLVRE